MNDAIRPYASGYSDAGASLDRRSMKGFTARSSSPNEDINWNSDLLRQRGRMLVMSSPVAASAIKTNRTKVVGTGLTPKASIDGNILRMSPEAVKDWQRKTEREFALWAEKKENCDAIGVSNFYQMQGLVVSNTLMSGDIFALKKLYDPTPLNPYSLRLHLIEADRVGTPYRYGSKRLFGLSTDGTARNGNPIYDGVEVDKNGMVVAYYICNCYPQQMILNPGKLKWTRVKAYGSKTGLPNILHILDTERPEQYRGVTLLAPVIEPLLNISRYTQSEIMAALIQTYFTAVVVTETNPSQVPFNEVGYGPDENPENPPDTYASENPNEYEMGPGTVMHLKQGEDVKFGNPNIPTAGFETFFRTICKEIGSALEIPYDTLLKEFNASYSASRAALMEAWEAFRMRRSWLVNQFCQPVYEMWLAEAVALGRIQAPGFFTDPALRSAWCKCQWLGPVQGQLDPTKEVKADILAVAHGFKTHEQVTREYGGGDWLENVERLKEENKLLAEAGTDAAGDADKFRNEPDLDPDTPGGGENA